MFGLYELTVTMYGLYELTVIMYGLYELTVTQYILYVLTEIPRTKSILHCQQQKHMIQNQLQKCIATTWILKMQEEIHYSPIK